jgi:SAM-dependent methyltransferase
MDLYDVHAVDYVAHAASSITNARYERPAVQAQLGEVRGKRVLDAGCAGGEHAAALLARGAEVVAIDQSAAMIAIVRQRFGDRLRAEVHDLRDPIVWLPDRSLDLILCSLTLHYLAEWEPTLREFRRLLREGGRLVFSTHHPNATDALVDDYFATVLVDDRWTIGGREHTVRFYHRPLQEIVRAVVASGFRVDALVEPRLAQAEAHAASDWDRRLRFHPWFLIVDASLA